MGRGMTTRWNICIILGSGHGSVEDIQWIKELLLANKK